MSNSKYDPLENHLKSLNYQSIPMSFEEIQEIVGCRLPPSAFKHRPWWSNNPSNSVITYAWLRAGYKTASVDMEGRRLIFKKDTDLNATSPEGAHKNPSAGSITRHLGMEEAVTNFDVANPSSSEDVFTKLYGCMKDTVKVAPGVNLAAGLFTDEELKSFDQKWNRLLTPNETEEH